MRHNRLLDQTCGRLTLHNPGWLLGAARALYSLNLDDTCAGLLQALFDKPIIADGVSSLFS
ncbi:MAG TPA: hypothetical protein VL462_00030 [Candidatus Nitrosotalea sp.]|jgi:hypothetical protein|nr:hypothetical protein [Candidatus Nitrosotalea sp.]